ncbi:glycoside hydrolase family 3 protein [Cryobacterium sp. 10C3]|uniref:glycoside hydrolase family 3 protein n=1 Tax=Cryobacterium sp. 10C3 TaxID=3048577 RepID=UPI002AB3BB84|nr:glycoside hydrolase family 3 N-terminal domain-containing protein [Cryobacterium sp. 10C3]MDY7558648.1 glycoside hydrolase family 3 N-terminal domain-containing protein [Cryobacterium sp. 10C3]
MTDTLSPAPSPVDAAPHAWQDTARSPAERVDTLLAAMTLREKVAQLYGVWVGASNDGGGVAPYQHDMEDVLDLDALLPHGLGQLTRPFGSGPVDAAVGVVSLARSQRRIVAAGRFGIPALAHEECLAGFTAWGATAYPVPLAWGATFDPGLVQEMSGRIGASMRSVGVHQGLAPVLDVVRDARWGRVEETIGEDPILVGTIATAYVRGLESAGIVATLKHFIGYSASKAGRNLAPVSIGSREFNDVLVPPFEMAVRESGVRSVMHAYTDIDGVPTAADPTLLTGLLRDTWGFTGTVVADYFGIAFLKTLHAIAETWGMPRCRPSAPASTLSCRPSRPSRNRSSPRSRPAGSRPTTSTAQPGVCCCRSSTSACSTPTGRRSRPAGPRPTSPTSRPCAGGSILIPPRAGASRAGSPNNRLCC